ncbi:MAG TPA: O-antigen ligase family protein [Pirellulaceae bacterium]|nr:O-antigen ligase family protein [Pirellulaceae bacterium]HMO92740.1 O-antigen ligase family protein [Pirellulaceae bacterium]HMP70292.1 O-antigen ligase family protein [Pirellulaceae bacterium]
MSDPDKPAEFADDDELISPVDDDSAKAESGSESDIPSEHRSRRPSSRRSDVDREGESRDRSRRRSEEGGRTSRRSSRRSSGTNSGSSSRSGSRSSRSGSSGESSRSRSRDADRNRESERSKEKPIRRIRVRKSQSSAINEFTNYHSRSYSASVVADKDETPISNPAAQPSPPAFAWAGKIILVSMVLISPWWIASVSMMAQFVLCVLALAGLGIWWLELAITRAKVVSIPLLGVVVACGLTYSAAQLIPLPNGIAERIAKPQKTLIGELASPVQGELPAGASPTVGKAPRTTVSLIPEESRQYINLIVIALICFLLAAHYFKSRKDVTWLLGFLTVQGAAISLFGLWQKFTYNGKIYWVVEMVHDGSPFGPFVNKNNAGGYLLLCLAAALGFASLAFTEHHRYDRPRPLIGNDYTFARRLQLKLLLFLNELTIWKVVSVLLAGCIYIGVLLTLSRGAVIALLIASVLTMWIVGLAKFPKATLAFSCLTICLVAILVGWLGAWDQLSNRFASFNDIDNLSNEARLDIWADAMQVARDYPVFGCGLNTFKDVFRSYRGTAETHYFEYAENAYVQTLVEAGVIGLGLLLAAIVFMSISVQQILTRGNSRKTGAVATIGTFALISQIAAGTFDFGLYIPAVMVLMAVVCGFVTGQHMTLAERSGTKWKLQIRTKGWLVQMCLLFLFTGGVFCALNLWTRTSIQSRVGSSPASLTYEDLNAEECDRRIESLKAIEGNQSNSMSLKRLAELYLHRCRIELLNAQTNAERFRRLSEQDQQLAKEEIWELTDLLSMTQRLGRTRKSGSLEETKALVSDPIITKYIPQVRTYLLASRQRNPFDPSVHLLLAELQAFSDTPEVDFVHLSRALRISPRNVAVLFFSGIVHLNAGRNEQAKKNLRKSLELNGGHLSQLVGYARLAGISNQEIIDDILPAASDINSALVLLRFANQFLSRDNEQALIQATLMRADQVFTSIPEPSVGVIRQHAEVKRRMGAFDEAIGLHLQIRFRLPYDERVHRDLLVLYEATSQWREAFQICGWLAKNAENPEEFRKKLEILRPKVK